MSEASDSRPGGDGQQSGTLHERASRPAVGGNVPVIRWLLFIALVWFLIGGVGVLVAVALALYVEFRGPQASVLLMVSAAAFALVPLMVLHHGLPAPFFVSPDFVRKDLPAHFVAGAGLLFLVVGVIRSVRTESGSGLEEREVGLLHHAPIDEEAVLLPARTIERSVAFGLALGTLSVLSFVLRVAVSKGAVPSPFTAEISNSLLHGQGFSVAGLFGGQVPTALRMPAVPALLSFAGTTATPAVVTRLLWALLGAATVTVTGEAARRLFGSAAGVVAAAIVAVFPVFFLQDVRLDSVPVAALLVALLLLATATPSGRSVTSARAFTAGVLGGLLALTRPEGVVLSAVILVAWLAGVATAREGGRRRIALVMAAVIGMLLVFGPWVLRNRSEFGTSLPTTEVGTIVAGADAPDAYGGPFVGSFNPQAAKSTIERVVTGPIGEGALDRKLRGAAFSYSVRHPAQLTVAALVRLLRTFDIWSPTNERAVHDARGVSTKGWTLQWASFVALLGLATWGYWRLWDQRKGLATPLFLAPVVVAIVALLSYGEPLMRGSIDPALAIVAAYPLASVLGPLTERRRRGRLDTRADGLVALGGNPASGPSGLEGQNGTELADR